MKNKKTIYNSDEFRKTVQCLTEKIREADELESVDVDKSFQDVMKRVGRERLWLRRQEEPMNVLLCR